MLLGGTVTKSNEAAIASGAARVDEIEDLTHGYSEQDIPPAHPAGALGETNLTHETLSMFERGGVIYVRIGNARNSSEFFENAFDTIREANEAMLEAGILKADQIDDPEQLAGHETPLSGVSTEQLERAGFKQRRNASL
jgi:hypothetical protein